MTANDNLVPRSAIKGIAFGILLMAFFSMMWLGIASSALSGIYYWLVTTILLAVLACFVVYAIALLKKSKEFPGTKVEDKAEGKRIQKWYGIIFGLEGSIIGISCAILGAKGLNDYIVPTIALIVGIHFYPMAAVFNRKFDYITGTWTTLIAIAALYFLASKTISIQHAFLLVGLGVAMATISYGLFMIAEAEKYKRHLKYNGRL